MYLNSTKVSLTNKVLKIEYSRTTIPKQVAPNKIKIPQNLFPISNNQY